MGTPLRPTKQRSRLGIRAVSLVVTLLVIALYVLVLTRGHLPIHLTKLIH